jgi:hypothetical protein
MTKVFIGGSRMITSLSSAVITRIENIINGGITILIGDANGADKAVQMYLAERKYANVVVHCSGGECRNNIGKWETNSAAAEGRQKGFRFYALKDEQMAKDADCGFMLWDMQSNGTLNNILNLLSEGKKTLVYLPAEDSFQTIRDADDLSVLLSRCDEKDLGRFEEKLALSRRLKETRLEPAAV